MEILICAKCGGVGEPLNNRRICGYCEAEQRNQLMRMVKQDPHLTIEMYNALCNTRDFLMAWRPAEAGPQNRSFSKEIGNIAEVLDKIQETLKGE